MPLKPIKKNCQICDKEFIGRPNYKTCSPECRKYVKGYQKGHKINIGNKFVRGKHWKLSEQTKKKMGIYRKGKSAIWNKGAKSHLWKGGITPINKIIRASLEYKLWRESVFKRDNYTCVWCGTKKSPFNADHIKPFAYYPELRFAIDNGRTLCVPCHKTTDTYLCKKPN